MNALKLIYHHPSTDWNDALPIGNGRLGAMIFGNTNVERIQLNEESVWQGGFVDRNNPDTLTHLAEVRELIFAGKIPEAEQLMRYAFSGMPQTQRCYQPLCDLTINFRKPCFGYHRELDLNTATVTISNVADEEITYKKEIFCSHPANVMVMRVSADQEHSLSFDCLLSRGRFSNRTWAESNNTIALDGDCGEQGVKFCGMLRATAKGGTVQTIGEHLVVKDADEVTLFFTAYTTFGEQDIYSACRETLDKASGRGYEQLHAEHLADYKSLFDRVTLELESDPQLESLPTNERLKRIGEDTPDNSLIALYYQFGRYLLISCSREGSLPATLQGIWNEQFDPMWGSRYTININTQMNYWIAESSGLSQCHLPLFEHLKRMHPNGKETARKLYGCRGFVAHHNTDIWGDTAPQDIYIPATYWVMGAAWLCLHIWEHYEYTQDLDFLREMYPILCDAALFFVDYLVPYQETLVTCPSVSPENTYILESGVRGCICFGSEMDNQILRDLFTACIKSSELLDDTGEHIAEFGRCLSQLPPTKIGEDGRILEWNADYTEAEPGHRHISHLFGLFPSSQITMEDTPELVRAARQTLEERLKNGGGHTGWSRAWIINLWAQLHDGQEAYQNILKLLQNSTLPNLFDNHPPFQIDGNFGAARGIVEMLVQSRNGHVFLLPALPKEWESGQISGIRLRGGTTLDMKWDKGRVTYVKLVPTVSYSAMLHWNDTVEKIYLEPGQYKIINE